MSISEAEREVAELSQKYGLEVDPSAVVEDLPVGTKQRVEIIKALYRKADILILDEPTAGMNPVERVKILDNIRRLSAIGKTTFVIVEHDMDVVFSLSKRVIVLHHGAVIGDGSTEDVQSNPRVREVYLGEEVAS